MRVPWTARRSNQSIVKEIRIRRIRKTVRTTMNFFITITRIGNENKLFYHVSQKGARGEKRDGFLTSLLDKEGA